MGSLKMKKEMIRYIICGILICVAIVLIVEGIARDEVATVFNKSTNICMECIGIG